MSARKLYYNDAISNKENLRGDIALIKEGHEPEYIPLRYNHFQQIRYRYWSLTFKDIENLRKMDYTEAQIENSLKGRGAFSKKEIKSLMLGLYMPTDMKELDMSKDTIFISLIKDLNKELGTHYTPSEVFDVNFMKEIEEKWKDIPLNLNEVMRNYNFTATDLYRAKQEMKKIQEKSKLEIKQMPKDIKREKEEMQEQMEWDMEKLQDDIEKLKKSNLPIGTPNVSSEVIASKPDQNTVGSTGLTATETAWLSNEEKAMRLKQKGLA